MMIETLSAPPAVEPLRDARRSFTRTRICDAARGLFAANGFAATTVEQIAQAAGTRRSTLYNHFRDKNEILAAIAEDYQAGLAALIERLPGPHPTYAEIVAWLEEVLAFSARERTPTIFFLSLGSAIDVPPALEGMGARLLQELARRLPAFARALEPGEDKALARAMLVEQQIGWLCLHDAQQRRRPPVADMLAVTAELFHDFVKRTG